MLSRSPFGSLLIFHITAEVFAATVGVKQLVPVIKPPPDVIVLHLKNWHPKKSVFPSKIKVFMSVKVQAVNTTVALSTTSKSPSDAFVDGAGFTKFIPDHATFVLAFLISILLNVAYTLRVS